MVRLVVISVAAGISWVVARISLAGDSLELIFGAHLPSQADALICRTGGNVVDFALLLNLFWHG